MVYQNILKNLENKLSDLWFSDFLEYFTKKNDFKSLSFLLEKTIWEKSHNNLFAIDLAILTSIHYKTPSFNLFYKLFKQLEFKGYEGSFSKITPEQVKKIKIEEIIKSLIIYDKLNFIEQFAKKEGLIVYEKATKYLVEKKLTYSLNILYDFRPSIINEYIESEKDSELASVLNNFSKRFQFEKLLLLNQPYIDKIVIEDTSFEENAQAFCISKFLKNNKFSMAKKWLDISFSEKTKEQKITSLKYIMHTLDYSKILKVKILKFLNKVCIENKLCENDQLANKYDNLVRKIIIKAIEHDKSGYLEKLRKELGLARVILDTSILNLYVNADTSEKMDNFIFKEISEQSFNLKEKINHYLLNRKMIIFLKEYGWDEIAKAKDLDDKNKSQLFFDYLTIKNKSKENNKKIKI